MTEKEEQGRIDLAVQRFNNQLQKLNKEHKFIQVTGFKLQFNHPEVVEMEPKKWPKITALVLIVIFVAVIVYEFVK